MKLIFTGHRGVLSDRTLSKGDEIDIPETEAAALIDAGFALSPADGFQIDRLEADKEEK